MNHRCRHLVMIFILPLFLGVQQLGWAAISSIHSNLPHSSSESEVTPVTSVAASENVINCCTDGGFMPNCSTGCSASFGASNSLSLSFPLPSPPSLQPQTEHFNAAIEPVLNRPPILTL